MTYAWVIAPVVACVVMAVALGWFGFHVLQREVIFVDLALAQIAALGTTYSVFLGHEPDEPISYLLGLLFTVLGAAGFSLSRRFSTRVPQEALIGIAYALSAALGALLLDFASDPHGAEKLQHLMVGNVVWVTWTEIMAIAAVCAGVGLVHAVFRDRFLAISLDPRDAAARGIPVATWDLVFYLTFGVVITTVVHVAGVLLVFSWLVIPAVIARLFVDGVLPRLLLAWAIAVPVSVFGIAVSYEHSAGPIIVASLGACLAAALAVWSVRRDARPVRALFRLVAGAAIVVGTLWSFSRLEIGEHHDDAVHSTGPLDPVARQESYRQHATEPAVLVRALATERDPSLRLFLGVALAKEGDPRGLRALADLTSSDVPFVRMEADATLRAVLPDGPTYDPLAGPDTNGLWSAAVAVAPRGWEQRAKALTLPF
jgi:zinc/manganese transport system permease protein